MKTNEIIKALRCCESNNCKDCLRSDEYPHGPKYINVIAAAADEIETLAARCARYVEEIAVMQERTRWVPVTERLPEVWRNDETSELVNYMIYSPDFGVDIGNYHAEAKKWLCMALPACVTHWRPLPAGPEVDQ